MTPSTPIRIVVLAVALTALCAPLAQADRRSDDAGYSQAGAPPDVFERAVLRGGQVAANASRVQSRQVAASDAFERAVLRAQAERPVPDAFERAVLRAQAERPVPDAFERAVTAASGHGLAPSDSHERSRLLSGDLSIVPGGGPEWADLSIGVFLGIALAGLGILGTIGIRGRMAHS